MILPDTDRVAVSVRMKGKMCPFPAAVSVDVVKFLPETGKKAGRGDAVLGRGG